MHCSRCSTENPTRAKFCLECGAPLAETATACPPAGRPPEAERRQLTCLSCDLVNSVELSERLDPEELRETLAAYRRACATVVRRFDGHVHNQYRLSVTALRPPPTPGTSSTSLGG